MVRALTALPATIRRSDAGDRIRAASAALTDERSVGRDDLLRCPTRAVNTVAL
jgi:hypothetical protein